MERLDEPENATLAKSWRQANALGLIRPALNPKQLSVWAESLKSRPQLSCAQQLVGSKPTTNVSTQPL